MSGMQEVFTRAVNTTPSDQQESLREAMTALRNSWDQLTMNLNSVTAQLKVNNTSIDLNFMKQILYLNNLLC